MPTRFPRGPLSLICSVAVVLLIALPRPGDARPNYKKCFDLAFPKIGKQNKTNCNLCHVEGTDDKKRLNHFGKAVAEELGEKKVKDEEKIIAAIKRAAKRKCKAGEWGERMEKGLPPCDCGDAECGAELVGRRHPNSRKD